jgi:hypothetical protein
VILQCGTDVVKSGEEPESLALLAARDGTRVAESTDGRIRIHGELAAPVIEVRRLGERVGGHGSTSGMIGAKDRAIS